MGSLENMQSWLGKTYRGRDSFRKQQLLVVSGGNFVVDRHASVSVRDRRLHGRPPQIVLHIWRRGGGIVECGT